MIDNVVLCACICNDSIGVDTMMNERNLAAKDSKFRSKDPRNVKDTPSDGARTLPNDGARTLPSDAECEMTEKELFGF